MKQFPIMITYEGTPGPCPSSIPWEAIAPYDGQAKQNHGGQSLERLAERGGLSPAEAFMVMHGRRWDLNEDVKALQKEACAFLDKLVRDREQLRIEHSRYLEAITASIQALESFEYGVHLPDGRPLLEYLKNVAQKR